MLSLKYVMAKSKELTSKLELGSVVGSVRSTNADIASSASSVAGSDAVTARSVVGEGVGGSGAGEAFLVEQSKDWDAVLVRHRKLLQSGEVLSDELARARKRLQDQAESEAYVAQHFHEIKRVREQLSTIRGLVEKIAEDVEHVEQYLMQQTEEYMAAQNASFVERQERELDLFEEHILEAKEDRKQQLLAARRQVLADAFQNDLKTYQTLVAYQGPGTTKRAMSPPQEESLESVDLVVMTDSAQLEAFYDTEDDEDAGLRFAEEEEKSNDETDAEEHKDEVDDHVEEPSTQAEATLTPSVEEAAVAQDPAAPVLEPVPAETKEEDTDAAEK